MNDHGYVVVSIAGHIVHAWGPADGRLFDTRAQAHSVIRRFRREDKARGPASRRNLFSRCGPAR